LLSHKTNESDAFNLLAKNRVTSPFEKHYALLFLRPYGHHHSARVGKLLREC